MSVVKRHLVAAVNLRRLIVCIILSEFSGIFMSFCAVSRWSVYSGFVKPPFSPDSWNILPIAAAFYLITGISAYAISDSHSYLTRRALFRLFFALIVNAVWAWVFFCTGNHGAAFGLCALCLGAVIYASLIFHKIDPAAAILLMPHIILECYLLVINYRIWILN